MNPPLIKLLLFALAFASPALADFTYEDSAKATASCNGGSFIGTTVFGIDPDNARAKAKAEIARNIISQIKSETNMTNYSGEKNGVLKEFSRFLETSKIESNLVLFGFKEVEPPKRQENGEYELKGYICPDKAAKSYLDSLKIINQHVSTKKLSNNFCETLYKTYSPKVMLFERILEYFGEMDEARIADYRKVEKECDEMSEYIKKGYVSFEEALDRAVTEIKFKVRGKTKIAIAEIDAFPSKISDFITAELSSKLVKSGVFTVVIGHNSIELAKAFGEKSLKTPGQMKNAEAAEIGKSLKANVVITGSFIPSTEFNQLRIRAIEVQGTKILALHTEKIRPDDAELSGLIPDKLSVIGEEALAYLNKGEDYVREGKYDAAIRELNKALAINENLSEGYNFRGIAYGEKGNYDKAIEDFTATLTIKPNDFIALAYRGIAYGEKGDYDLAIDDFNATLRIKPDALYNLYNRGLTYSNKGNYDQAIKDYNAVLRIKPNDLYTMSNRGFAHLKKHSYDQAIKDFTAALRIKPNDYETLCYRGLAYSAKDEDDWAIEDYTAALRIKSDYLEALHFRGISYFAKGNYDQAIKDFTAALRIKPDDQEILSNRRDAYTAKGDFERAVKDISAAQKINYEANLNKQGNEYYAKVSSKSFTDSRDGKKYKTVTIGKQTWMAENLNYNANGSKCYNNDPAYCQKYGRLYNWNTAMKACPMSWHLPSNEEWQVLVNLAGGNKVAGKKLKAASGWNSNGNGQDTYGFSAMPGGTGAADYYSFSYVGTNGGWWSSTESSNDKAYYRVMLGDDERVNYYDFYKQSFLQGVRCVKD